jgi:Ca2+/H+ antiporter, TMEM165/GDT1 family
MSRNCHAELKKFFGGDRWVEHNGSVTLRNTLTAFSMVFPAELPDKSMFATLVLTSRFRRPGVVWCGVAAAFSMHVMVAVTAGSLIHRLPQRLVGGVTALLFAVGAVMLWRESNGPNESNGSNGSNGSNELSEVNELTTFSESAESPEMTGSSKVGGAGSPGKAGSTNAKLRNILVTSFVTVGLAEWGDLTQLATASLAADRGDPVGIGMGAYVALVTVAGLAVLVGRWVVRVVPLQHVRKIAAVLFAGLAFWTFLEVI